MQLSTIAYRPVSLVASLAAASLAGVLFKQVWKRVADEEDAPSALQSEYSLPKVLAAAAIQAVIFASVKVLMDRGGAKAFERITGSWPGN